MQKPRKHHVQQDFTFRTWGGKRQGAGRPAQGKRASERHEERPAIDDRHPLHVTVRIGTEVGSLRRARAYHAVRMALATVLSRTDFRIVHISLQRTHLHLIVESSSKKALAKGMQGFQISAARHLNAAIFEETGVKRRGVVFTDRYHPRALSSPKAVRHALSYVLNNWRRHGEDRRAPSTRMVDPYSSGVNFGGWRELDDSPVLFSVPKGFSRLTTSVAQTWLLREGWSKSDTISVWEQPGSDAKRDRVP
jgi:REP element-mobilizing transposase RayT